MRNITLPILCLLYALNLSAQDLIVTSKGDSINAQVTEVKNGVLFFSYKKQGEIVRTSVSTDSIKTMQYNYYKKSEVSPSYRPDVSSEVSKWRLGGNWGWSFRTAKIPDSYNSFERDYFSKLKHCHHYDLEANYFFSKRHGVGLIFSDSYASNSAYVTAQLTNGSLVSGPVSDNIHIYYFAPEYLWRFPSRDNMSAFLISISLGYMGYSDDGEFLTPYHVNGNTVGLSYGAAYDFGLSQDIALTLGLDLRVGTLTTVELTQNGNTQTLDLTKTNSEEGLSRFDISIGLRFR